jgi:TRAP-type uncharacterized transport system fused permease subunit
MFVMAILGAFAFTNAVQGWFITRNKWYEVPIFLLASLIFFFPAVVTRVFGLDPGIRYYMYLVAAGVYAMAFLLQRARVKSGRH